uniref:Uncharacterized protein n=1 Tax=Anabas testudineus TaxID=64144 RepID=A0A3Q1JTW1_ANATE
LSCPPYQINHTHCECRFEYNTVTFHSVWYLLSELKQIKAASRLESKCDIQYALQAARELSEDEQEGISRCRISPALFFAQRLPAIGMQRPLCVSARLTSLIFSSRPQVFPVTGV